MFSDLEVWRSLEIFWARVFTVSWRKSKVSGCTVAERSFGVVSSLGAVLVVMVIRRVGYLMHLATISTETMNAPVSLLGTLCSHTAVSLW